MNTEKQGSKRTSKGRTTQIKRDHRSRKTSDKRLSKRIDDYKRKEDWDSIIGTLEKVLETEPDNHWLLAEIASAYYEKKDYENSYKYIVDAMWYQENCPLVLWHLASIFRMQDRQEDAITIWEELISRGEEKLAFDACGEGLEWARSLIADCRYMISKSYLELGDVNLYRSYKEAYQRDIDRGIISIYNPSSL